MKGSCLCGTMQYEIDQLDGSIGHCHCRGCRKSNAGAFTSTARVNRDRFRWLKGRERLSSLNLRRASGVISVRYAGRIWSRNARANPS
jgi:hypothetical protein